MKNTLIIIGLIAFMVSCQSNSANKKATLNILDYQKDIQYLKDILPIKHPNLFFHQSKKEFYENLDFIASEINLSSKNEAQIIMQLREATAELGDPHTNFGFYDVLRKGGYFPIEIFWFEDGIWITGADSKYQNAIGKKIIEINGVSIEEVIEKVSKVVPENAPYFRHKRMHYFLPMYAILNYYEITPKPLANFKLSDVSGKTENIEIGTVKGDYNPDTFEHLEQTPYYWLSVQGDNQELFRHHFFKEDGILFIQYNSCWSRELEERHGKKEDAKSLPSFNDFKNDIFEIIKNEHVNKILFDMRFNGGGSSPQGTALIKELSTIESINQKGKLFVATSQHTFSSAVINAMNFRQSTNSILVGTPTGGSPNHYGEVRTLILPKTKMEIYHSTDYFKFIDKDLEAVIPDVTIPTKFIDISNGIDPIYEYVKNYAQHGK